MEKKVEFQICVIDSELTPTKTFENKIEVKEGLAKKAKCDYIESYVEDGKMIADVGYHSFLLTVQIAHSYHIPIQMSPDDIWTLVMQGFCQHMKYNHEKLKSKFVDFED